MKNSLWIFYYEIDFDDIYNPRHIHYIGSPTGLAAIVVDDGTDVEYYCVYTDHLGSILTVTDDQGDIVAEQNFDAWGRRRNPNNWTYNNIPDVPAWMYRGFTGHEHVPQFALINMNGRLYDPVLGRMLSPDNYVQSPFSTQSYNRYSYVFNNPLSYVDPDGEMAWWIPVVVGAAIGGYVGGGVASGTWNPFTKQYWQKGWKGYAAGTAIGAAIGFGVSYGMSFIDPSSPLSTNHALHKWSTNRAFMSKGALNNSFDYFFKNLGKSVKGIPVEQTKGWIPIGKININAPNPIPVVWFFSVQNLTTNNINLNNLKKINAFTGQVRFEFNRLGDTDVSADIRRYPFKNKNIVFNAGDRILQSDPIKLKTLNRNNIFQGHLSHFIIGEESTTIFDEDFLVELVSLPTISINRSITIKAQFRGPLSMFK